MLLTQYLIFKPAIWNLGSRHTKLTSRSRVTCQRATAALERIKEIRADGQLACTFCKCIRWNASTYYQVAVLCIHYSWKGNSKTTLMIQQHFVLHHFHIWKYELLMEPGKCWRWESRGNCTGEIMDSTATGWRGFPFFSFFSSNALMHFAVPHRLAGRISVFGWPAVGVGCQGPSQQANAPDVLSHPCFGELTFRAQFQFKSPLLLKRNVKHG